MIITTAIIKGGTGKSTTAAALAQAAIKENKRVLCIDLDAQANLTFFLGAKPAADGSYTLIKNGVGNIQETKQGIFLYAACAELALLTTKHGSARRLADALEHIKDSYDLIIIDTPPAIGDLTYNALFATDGVIFPLEADANAIQGLKKMLGICQQIKKTNQRLFFLGAFITRYSAQSKLNKYLRDTIAAQVEKEGIPYLGEVRQGIAIKEAQTLQENIFDYAPKSNAARDYIKIYKELTI